MRVLVACEYSGRVREAFRARGHDAYSCDLLECEDGSRFHIQGDALEVAKQGWDLLIAHPPCTHLAVSCARHFEAKREDGRQQEAIDFFLALARLPIPRIAIENPVCIMSSLWRKPDQTIQPWMFGHGETKATCLWLKGLPHLVPTNIVSGRHPRVHLMPTIDNWRALQETVAFAERIQAQSVEMEPAAIRSLLDERDRLAAEVEALRADARRYRWLRDVSVPPHNFYVAVPVEFEGVKYTPAEVDAGIDAAMKGKP